MAQYENKLLEKVLVNSREAICNTNIGFPSHVWAIFLARVRSLHSWAEKELKEGQNVMAKKIRVVPQGQKKKNFFTFIFSHQFYLAGFAEQSAFAEESPTKLSATQVTKRAN